MTYAWPLLSQENSAKIRYSTAVRSNRCSNVSAPFAPNAICREAPRLTLFTLRDPCRFLIPVRDAGDQGLLARLTGPRERPFDLAVRARLPVATAVALIQLLTIEPIVCGLHKLAARTTVMARRAQTLVDVDVAITSVSVAALFADPARLLHRALRSVHAPDLVDSVRNAMKVVVLAQSIGKSRHARTLV